MGDEIVYGLLELTFAKINNIEPEDELYTEKIGELFPSDWNFLELADRIKILNEAIAESKGVTETQAYDEMVNRHLFIK